MDIHNTDEVFRFVEQVIADNIINRIECELRSKPYYELESLLQQSGCSISIHLARKMLNIYKDQLTQRK